MRMNEQKEHLLRAVDKAILEAEPLWLSSQIGRNLVWSLPTKPKTIVLRIPGTNIRYKLYNYEETLELFKKEIKKVWRKE